MMASTGEVDEEIRRLLERLADSTGPVWDGSVILRLKALPLACADWLTFSLGES